MPIRCAHYRGQSRFLLILHTILCHCMCIVTAKTKQNHTQNTHTNLFLFQPCLFLGLTSGLYLLSIQLTSCVSGFNRQTKSMCQSDILWNESLQICQNLCKFPKLVSTSGHYHYSGFHFHYHHYCMNWWHKFAQSEQLSLDICSVMAL